MKRFLLVLGLLLGSCIGAQAQQIVGPQNAILCNLTATFTGTGSLAQVIGPPSAVGSNPNAIIVVCGWAVTSSATGTFILETGTGSTCGSNTVNVTGTLNIATAPLVVNSSFGKISTLPAGEVCVNSTVTTSSGVIFYAQF